MAMAGLVNDVTVPLRPMFMAIGLVLAQLLPSQDARALDSASISFHQRSVKGELSACEILFVTVGEDAHYKQPPSTIILSGPLFFTMREDGTAVELFKVCGFDAAPSSEQFNIDYAYPIVGDKPVRQLGEVHHNTDRCHLSVFPAFNLLASNFYWHFYGMRIGYARRAGGQDVVVDLRYGAHQIESILDAERSYTDCTIKLLKKHL